MQLNHDWSRLQQIADQRMARRTLRAGAVGSIVFGSLSLGLGLMPPASPIATAVGAVLLGTGMWNITRPRPAGIVIDGLTLVMVGLYNILGTVTGGGLGLWVKLGVFQLIWGVQGVMRYAKFKSALSFEAQDTELRAFDEMVRAIEKTNVKDDAHIVDFVTTGFHAKRWRAQLTDTAALVVVRASHEVLVVGRHELDIQPGGKVMIGKDLKATFTIKGKTVKGTVSPQSLERFQTWKMGHTMPRAIAA